MHYTEHPGDIVSKQLYPNGAVCSIAVLNNGKPANGWSKQTYYPEGNLQDEENYSNGLLIEKINYNEKGVITRHKIWNNRLRLLVDKPVHPKLPRPNVVTGYGTVTNYLNALPEIAIFIDAVFDKAGLLQSYQNFLNTDDEEASWQMKGREIKFTIYWQRGELSYQWHCHCYTEEQYKRTRLFLGTIL